MANTEVWNLCLYFLAVYPNAFMFAVHTVILRNANSMWDEFFYIYIMILVQRISVLYLVWSSENVIVVEVFGKVNRALIKIMMVFVFYVWWNTNCI